MKSYTDLDQSKKLAEFLPIESADMWHHGFFTPSRMCKIEYNPPAPYHSVTPQWDCPCWSLAALFGVLPKFIGDYSKCLYYDVDGCYCGYMNDGDFMLTIKETKAGNPVDACVKMIERLHEFKML